MKKIFILITLVAISVACSKSDDDNSPEPIKFASDYLVEGSPWNFDGVDVLTVDFNPNNLTVSEVDQLLTTLYTGFKYDFKENNTGSATLPDGTGYSFNWSFAPSNDGIDFTTIILTGQLQGVFKNVVANGNTFSYDLSEVCTADGKGDDVCINGKFSFK